MGRKMQFEFNIHCERNDYATVEIDVEAFQVWLDEKCPGESVEDTDIDTFRAYVEASGAHIDISEGEIEEQEWSALEDVTL